MLENTSVEQTPQKVKKEEVYKTVKINQSKKETQRPNTNQTKKRSQTPIDDIINRL
jgi:hypothetical protein